ncbi:MAG: ATPase domain-containing protein [Candidatus Micrarchaeota archaeon]
MERVPTGIEGLDRLIEGGFPRPSSILLTGATGSGKSILGIQYLYKGAVDHDEPGIMISIESYATGFQWYAERFNFDIGALQKKKKLIFTSYDPADFRKFELRTLHSEIILQINRLIDQIGAKRLVIDSIAPIGHAITDRDAYRTLLYYISKAMKEKGVTTIFITEKPKDKLTTYDFEQYVMDGVLELSFVPKDDALARTLIVHKMVATNFPQAGYLVEIGDSGMSLVTTYV